MSMLLLLPIGLAALASLLLPLLVHLARRSEQRVVPFAALRWLRALPQPRRKHRFEELLLMLLRLLLLAALALLLAQPVLFGRPDRRPWVAVAPGVDLATGRALASTSDARWHWLTPGFPRFDPDDAAPPAQSDSGASFASLLRELDAQLPASTPLTVVLPAVLEDADAQRPVLSRKADWRVLPPAAARAPATPPPQPTAPFRLQVRHTPDRTASLRYLRAAGVAWAREDANAQTGTPPSATQTTIAAAGQALDPQIRSLAWLVPGEVPAPIRDWVADGGRILLDAGARWPGFPDDAPVAWSDAQGALARTIRAGNGRVIRLERPLLPAAMPGLLEADFPLRLRALFADAPALPGRVAAADFAPRTGSAPYPEHPQPLAPWLVWLVAGLFLLERLLASGRRRSEAA